MLQDSSSLAGEFNPFTPEGTPLRVKEETESHALTGKGGGRGRRVGGGGVPLPSAPRSFGTISHAKSPSAILKMTHQFPEPNLAMPRFVIQQDVKRLAV